MIVYFEYDRPDQCGTTTIHQEQKPCELAHEALNGALVNAKPIALHSVNISCRERETDIHVNAFKFLMLPVKWIFIGNTYSTDYPDRF